MFAEYLQAAMKHAVYEQMEDGTYFGTVPVFPGAWANGTTPEACAQEWESVIEGWILLAIADREELPVIDGRRLVANASV